MLVSRLRACAGLIEVLAVVVTAAVVTLGAQAPVTKPAPADPPAAAPTNDGAPLPSDYLIGPADVLSIVFFHEKEESADVVVRPDGKISLALLNDIEAAGLTPDQLRDRVTQAASKYFEDPAVTVIVKQINSRKVFITGSVNKPGAYPLTEHMTVVQLIAVAGGLQEFADKDNIAIVHIAKRPDGVPWSDSFNYNEFLDRRNLQKNIELKPGDTVVVR
jgi:polysaccharide biosynthesis/export protein